MTHPELLFKAMADVTRRRLLQVLCGQALSVSELVWVLDQPQSTVSRHLKVLREAGLLVDERRGATVRYTAWPPQVNGSAVPASLLRDRLLEWLGHEPLEASFRKRLEQVLRRREADSTGFFESVGARWDQMRIEAFGESFHLEALTALLPTGWAVADIGTGTGWLLPLLAARFRTVIAVEPAGSMLDAARRRMAGGAAGHVLYREGSIADLPLADGEVDLAIASLVLHHVERPAEALAEVRRCLREEGRVLIIEQQRHDDAAFHQRMGDYWPGFEPPLLAQWVGEAGFTDVRVTPLASVRTSGRQAGEAPGLFAVTARCAGGGEAGA